MSHPTVTILHMTTSKDDRTATPARDDAHVDTGTRNALTLMADGRAGLPVLGRLLVHTPAVAAWIADADTAEGTQARGVWVAECVRIHALGRWELTDNDEHDQEVNRDALTTGARVLTSHVWTGSQADGADGFKIWVITEAVHEGVRASTCILTPADY
ncbi:hypothetical protein GCM10025873_22690 [Demequina sediminis]|nr:hypothetical protein GCM10025873_22690 [Demequina sediminis]